MIKTDICDLLQIEYPILQGGMAWLGTAELAAAVSEAGGLGLIGAGHMPPDIFRNEIHKLKERTNKPFGCNIMLMSPFVKEVMEVVVEERVPVITTGAGNPGVYIPALKEIGTKVIPVVASVLLAKRLLRGGIDAIIAEGTESGGHVGDITTMALIPQVVDAVDVPVIAVVAAFSPFAVILPNFFNPDSIPEESRSVSITTLPSAICSPPYNNPLTSPPFISASSSCFVCSSTIIALSKP